MAEQTPSSEPKTPAKVDYEVTEAREINGVRRKVGDPVQLTERQAQYYLPPLGSGLKLAAAAQSKPGARQTKSDKAAG